MYIAPKALIRGSLMGVVGALFCTSVYAQNISGAGATFPYPVYSRWAQAYQQETGTNINYQAIGSGGGIRQIKEKTVTFGASDSPLKPEELEQAGLVQFPMIMGGVVPVVNLEGVQPGQLRLGGCSGGTLDFNFFVENGLAEFLKPSQWLRTTYEAPYQRYE